MINPVAHALRNAPVEDEEIGKKEEQAVASSKEWFEHNQGTSLEEVGAELGFSMDEIRNSKEPLRILTVKNRKDAYRG